MKNISAEYLNEQAMQMILHGGDSRNLIMDALRAIEEEGDIELALEKMKEAEKELTEAHSVQTKVIQQTIMEEDATPTLLFAHAQDTIMTIKSEYNIAKHIIGIYRRLTAKE